MCIYLAGMVRVWFLTLMGITLITVADCWKCMLSQEAQAKRASWPRKFTVVCNNFFYLGATHITCTLAQGTHDSGIVEVLRKELETLKTRCEILESDVTELKSQCHTHEKMLETFRKEILDCQVYRGAVDNSYLGEEYDLRQ
jgi:hypothetical protein